MWEGMGATQLLAEGMGATQLLAEGMACHGSAPTIIRLTRRQALSPLSHYLCSHHTPHHHHNLEPSG